MQIKVLHILVFMHMLAKVDLQLHEKELELQENVL